MKVQRLDDTTINQIAAGEIVERPASVVKELTENAIDAGATRIEIEIKNGGRQLIKIVDNGCGMEQEDAVLAVERHATSKIHSADDLLQLTSLGFRGEALPSIAAVSAFTMTTKTAENDLGTTVEIKGGILRKVKNVGAPDGTTITVQDLFYNTPARFKYMKSIPTEAGYINEIVTRLALGFPNISFRLKHHDLEMLFTPGSGRLDETIISLFGKEVAKEMIPVEFEDRGIKISGFYGKPSIARTNRKYEIFYVNHRYIHSKILSLAVEKAYHTLLPIARYPFVVLFLELAEQSVDVNVHPTKLEVRFADESDLYKLVYHTVHNSLKDNSLISEWINPDDSVNYRQAPLRPGTAPIVVKKQAPTVSAPLNYAAYNAIGESHVSETREEMTGETTGVSLIRAGNDDAREEAAPAGEYPSLAALHEAPENKEYKNWYVYPKTVQNTYIIAQDDQGLLFVDQHAAHERILYEKYLYQTNEILGSQALLIPETLTLDLTQLRVINERMFLFKDLGFDLEAFGGKTIIIRGVPLALLNLEYSKIILELIEEYLNFKTFKSPSEIKETFIITMACRTAVKAGDRLNHLESEGLIKDLFKCENPYTCPHGRPTLFRMTIEELAKKFLRR